MIHKERDLVHSWLFIFHRLRSLRRNCSIDSENSIFWSFRKAPITLHRSITLIESALESALVINGMRTSVLLNETELISIYISVYIKLTDFVWTWCSNWFIIYGHCQFHIGLLLFILVITWPYFCHFYYFVRIRCNDFLLSWEMAKTRELLESTMHYHFTMVGAEHITIFMCVPNWNLQFLFFWINPKDMWIMTITISLRGAMIAVNNLTFTEMAETLVSF